MVSERFTLIFYVLDFSRSIEKRKEQEKRKEKRKEKKKRKEKTEKKKDKEKNREEIIEADMFSSENQQLENFISVEALRHMD